MRPKPRRGNRGQAHRDDVARRQRADQARREPPAKTDRAAQAGKAGKAAKAGQAGQAKAATQAKPTKGATRGTKGATRGARGATRGAKGTAGTPPAQPGTRRPPSRGLGGDQVEGRQAVRELLAAGTRRVRDVWLAEGVEDSPVLTDILTLAAERRVAVREVPRARLEAEARTDAPQGVLAHADPLLEVDLERLARRPGAFLVAVDGVTDPHNLGALLRTAESAGATGAVLPRHRAAHVTPTVAKAAAGAIEHLPIAVVPGLPAALLQLAQWGVWRVGLDGSGQTSVFELDLAAEPVCLILGAEGTGLSRLARARCDVVASIPQRGAISSLNVAAAAAVACYEVARRRLQARD